MIATSLHAALAQCPSGGRGRSLGATCTKSRQVGYASYLMRSLPGCCLSSAIAVAGRLPTGSRFHVVSCSEREATYVGMAFDTVDVGDDCHHARGAQKARKRPTGRFRSTRRSACRGTGGAVLQAFRGLTRTATRSEGTTTVSCTGATSPPAISPATRESTPHAGFRRPTWRDPDSNRGHHDFQS
jgi:hypothetical protein